MAEHMSVTLSGFGICHNYLMWYMSGSFVNCNYNEVVQPINPSCQFAIGFELYKMRGN